MTRPIHPPMTGGAFDRDAATRLDETALDRAWSAPGTQVLRLRDGSVAVHTFREREAALDFVPVRGERDSTHWYLGTHGGRAYFAVAVTEGDSLGTEPAAGWLHPFEFGSWLSPVESEMLAVALALSAWHQSMGFSPRDGSPTVPVQGGWARHDEHGGEHFPRTDPVVIVLVEHDDRLLLGSNVLWESGRFSLLAGFVEAGESAEQAVAREVYEEAGVLLQDIQYVTSQPWPFPRSFMMGFRAQLAAGADPDALHPDPSEISELRWFTRDELRNPTPGLLLPMPMSIARWLIDLWVAEGGNGSGQSE